jgi:hypothetical protein
MFVSVVKGRVPFGTVKSLTRRPIIEEHTF